MGGELGEGERLFGRAIEQANELRFEEQQAAFAGEVAEEKGEGAGAGGGRGARAEFVGLAAQEAGGRPGAVDGLGGGFERGRAEAAGFERIEERLGVGARERCVGGEAEDEGGGRAQERVAGGGAEQRQQRAAGRVARPERAQGAEERDGVVEGVELAQVVEGQAAIGVRAFGEAVLVDDGGAVGGRGQRSGGGELEQRGELGEHERARGMDAVAAEAESESGKYCGKIV